MTDQGSIAWRGLAVYLALTFCLSWAAQVTLVAVAPRLSLSPAVGGLATFAAAAALMWPPAVGAFVARRWIERSNFTDAGLRWPRWPYLALAWLGPPALTLGSTLLSLSLYQFDWNLTAFRALLAQRGQSSVVSPAVVLTAQILYGLTFAVPINSLFAIGEEFGWRGYLLPRSIALLGPWKGVLFHGTVWGIWHAPFIVLAGHNYPRHHLLGVPLFIVFCVLAGLLLGWLYLASGSLIPPTVAHASLNAVGGTPLVLLREVDPAVGGVVYSPLGWIVLSVAVALTIRFGGLPSLLRRYQRGATTPAVKPS